MPPPSRPPFSALALDKAGPPGNAWGLYGKDDMLGALNLLTPEVVAAAASEIKSGHRVSLDWSLDMPSHSSFDRQPFESKMWNRTKPGAPHRCVNDDVLHFNTQCSSQWDGFRHYGYQKAQRYYNNHPQSSLSDPTILGIDTITAAGGIVSRGLLLDFPAYRTRHSLPPVDPFTSTAITLPELQQMVTDANLVPRTGDILFIRSGFTAAYTSLSADERVALAARPQPDFLGVEASREVLEWLWASGFAAVAGDAPSFERAPIAGGHTAVGGQWKGESWEEEMQGGGLLHQWLLGGWGVPIGEMFDLEGLAGRCVEEGRWSFFVSSVPLKVPGGVASPPNAVAIF